MARDKLRSWLRWMPGWLLLPVAAAILSQLYTICAIRGLWSGLKEAHLEVRHELQVVRGIIEKERGDE
jgi:hypothetical protein